MNALLKMHRGFLPGRHELAGLAAHAANMRIVFARLSHEYQVNDSVSRFFGRGLEFEELRAYQPGDDVRSIDWRATARTGRPHVKKYREERQQVLILMLEVRKSMLFGSGQTTKCAQAVRVAALLAYAMKHRHHRVGVLLWGDFGSLAIEPAAAADTLNRLLDALSGDSHSMNMLTGTITADAGASDLIRYTERMPRGRKLAFISDFMQWQADEWQLIGRLRQRHETCAVQITDPREETMPDVGLARMTDMSGDDMIVVDSGSQACRDAYAACWKLHLESLQQRLNEVAIPLRRISTRDGVAALTRHITDLAI